MPDASDPYDPTPPGQDLLVVLLPLLIVLSTFLFLLLLFLVSILVIRRRRGIVLRDQDGPVDMSREELIHGEGGFDGVESRWLESADDSARAAYMRAKDYQLQYPPNSLPTDITLSQFLSIQEKGVSAWCFEPDYETVSSLLVHARTEITFLPDPASSSCVQSNLPLPKLNEVYYWEVKMFDLPATTTVAVGLATKPYPAFRLPGLNRYSVAYHSTGDKSHNYPFTAMPFGPILKEGDVVGVGYRPRTGTVFYTRNGRKMEDAFVGLTKWNLFPTIGADGPCSVHVNLGQAGFVFIEANVKKWGLAPSVGTLAPPPAYGSERGSILLDVGGRIQDSEHSSRRSRSRRAAGASSPLRTSSVPFSAVPLTPPPPITPIGEEDETPGPSGQSRYISPTDFPFHAIPSNEEADEDNDNESIASTSTAPLIPSDQRGASNPFNTPWNQPHTISTTGSELTVQVHPPPESPRTPNPPTPNVRDIHLQALTGREHRRTGSSGSLSSSLPVDRLSGHSSFRRDPPAYSPLDSVTYADGVHIDLPAEFITAALEGQSVPQSAMGHGNGASAGSRRSRRR